MIRNIASFRFMVGDEIYTVCYYKSESEDGLYDHSIFEVRCDKQWIASCAYNKFFKGITPSSSSLRTWVQHYVLEGALGIPAQEIAEEV